VSGSTLGAQDKRGLKMISPEMMYSSIRQEILDQKKCQFNLFGASITLTAAVLAYGAATSVGPIVYLAPIVLNALAIMMILDKARSIQRMVGYLQLMESKFDEYNWMWEYHLNLFRKLRGVACGPDSFRRHSYVITVASVLLVLNSLCAALYRWSPTAIAFRSDPEFPAEFYGAVDFLVLGLLAWGVYVSIKTWLQLLIGKFTGVSVEKRWLEALSKSLRVAENRQSA